MNRHAAAAILFMFISSPPAGWLEAADDPTPEAAANALASAATFYLSKVARHGGYVYFYSVDLQQRFGEGVATPDQIWVQPPGTPTVGMAYLKAFEATGDEFYRNAATQAAEALIYGQLQSGAWTNCIDVDPRGQRTAFYRNGKGRGRNFSSLDDDQSQAAIGFLMRADRAHEFKHKAIHEAVEIALEALLRAQFANGAFPQGWDGPVDTDQPVIPARMPKYDWRTEGRIKNYWDMYTLNDGLAGNVARVLIEAHEIYGKQQYQVALERLGDFLLLAQLPEPQPAWCQQYSYEMYPIWARKFEPPAVAGRESQDVLETLMAICEHTGEAKYLQPIPPAIAYLRRSRLPDGRLARYYELGTNRPLYMHRRGKVYSLTHDDSRLPDHYGWKCASRLDEIEARYARLRANRHPPEDRRSERSEGEHVQSIIDELDSQGRWISTFQGEPLVGDQKFRPGQQYISSAVFSDNMEALSEYLMSRR